MKLQYILDTLYIGYAPSYENNINFTLVHVSLVFHCNYNIYT